MKAVPLGVALAVLWAVLHEEYSLRSLVIGGVIGCALLILLYQAPGTGMPEIVAPSGRKYWRSGLYALRLVWEIVLAGLTITRLILRRHLGLQPGVIVVPADVRGDVEVTLLANSITLTPGTWTLDVPRDQSVLYVHALDAPDPEQTRSDIKQRLEKFVVEASRC